MDFSVASVFPLLRSFHFVLFTSYECQWECVCVGSVSVYWVCSAMVASYNALRPKVTKAKHHLVFAICVYFVFLQFFYSSETRKKSVFEWKWLLRKKGYNAQSKCSRMRLKDIKTPTKWDERNESNENTETFSRSLLLQSLVLNIQKERKNPFEKRKKFFLFFYFWAVKMFLYIPKSFTHYFIKSTYSLSELFYLSQWMPHTRRASGERNRCQRIQD